MSTTQISSAIGKPLAHVNLNAQTQRFIQVFSELGFRQVESGRCLKFEGHLNQRKTTVTIGARSRNKYMTSSISRRVFTGLMITVQMETDIETYLMISNAISGQSWLVRLLQMFNGNQRVSGVEQYIPGYHVFASEPEWAIKLLSCQTSSSPFRNLLYKNDGNPTGNLVCLGPKVCNFTPAAIPDDINVPVVRSWLEPLAGIADQIEQNRPANTAKLNWIGRQSKQGTLWLWIVSAIGCLSVILMVFVFCIAMLAFVLLS